MADECTCQFVDTNVVEYIARDLDDADTARIAEHLASCERCTRLVTRCQNMWELMKEIPTASLSPAEVDESFQRAIVAGIRFFGESFGYREDESAQRARKKEQMIWKQQWDARLTEAATREKLIQHYRPLTEHFTEHLSRKLADIFPGKMTKSLQEWAIDGLVEAISAYEPSDKLSFANFSRPYMISTTIQRLRESHLDASADVLARESMTFEDEQQSPGEAASRFRVRPDPVPGALAPLAFIRTLDAQERRFVFLYYFEDLSLTEISSTLQVPITQVREMHRRIIRHARKKVETSIAKQ